jgi:hypothetical protein
LRDDARIGALASMPRGRKQNGRLFRRRVQAS